MACAAARGRARRVRQCSRCRSQDVEEPQRRVVEARRVARRGSRTRWRRNRREEPRSIGSRARGRGPGDRNRRREVRRSLHGSNQGLRVRLGSNACVRRQHCAVPAIRPRPAVQHLSPRRDRPPRHRRRRLAVRRLRGPGTQPRPSPAGLRYGRVGHGRPV